MVTMFMSYDKYALNVLYAPQPIPTFLFFSKTIFENLILDIYFCPFFKILETFIN